MKSALNIGSHGELLGTDESQICPQAARFMHAFVNNIKLVSVRSIVWTLKQHLSSKSHQICGQFEKAASGHDSASRSRKICWNSQHRFLYSSHMTRVFILYKKQEYARNKKKARRKIVWRKMYLPQPLRELRCIHPVWLSLLFFSHCSLCTSSSVVPTLHSSISAYPSLSPLSRYVPLSTILKLCPLFPSHF